MRQRQRPSEGTAVIGQCDGSTPETVTLSAPDKNGNLTYYPHVFSVTTNRIIVIKGENITHPDCDFLQLTTLDVSKNTEMEWLDCQWYQLTSLDLTQNRSVKNSLVSTLRSQLNSYLCGVK